VAKRTEPLRPATPETHHDAQPSSAALAEAEAEMALLADEVALAGRTGAHTPRHDPHAEASRLQRLADGVRQLRTGGGTLRLNERMLLVIGGILAPLGLVLVLVGWYGAAHTPNLFEQIPYLISGGLFGLGLVFLGSFAYYTHWVTELVKEHRAQSASVVEAIGRVEELLRAAPATAVAATAPVEVHAATNGEALVATEKGTMAHRPDCVVVAGKTGLRPVSPDEGLATCKLCTP
jgi:hypothetical protein